MRSFLFCTSFINNGSVDHPWGRYRRWVNHHRKLLGAMGSDRMVLIDDAGPDSSDEITLIKELPDRLEGEVVVYRFEDPMQRRSVEDYPGWWRSFSFSLDIARKYGYRKIVHVESDFFVLSKRLAEYIGRLDHDWNCMYSRHYDFPESGIQVICEDVFEAFAALQESLIRNSFKAGDIAERVIPFTHIHKQFIGDRLGERPVLAGWLDTNVDDLGRMDFIGQMYIPMETGI